jgi:uncharacterized MAPEG superfamily protein
VKAHVGPSAVRKRASVAADLWYVVYSVLLTWVMLLTASFLRARMWTPAGIMVGVGNRDDVPEPTPIAARADRAAKNMLENLVLFVALVVAVRLSGVDGDALVTGASVFFWARVAYFLVYLAGIKLLRTVVWLVSIAGLWLILAPAL